MPGITLHLHVAETILGGWEGRSPAPPFPLHDARCRNAFLQGALGPDVGYVPGGHGLLSDLAHCLSTGRLNRTLLREAGSTVERAYAWGWLTHALADREIHPLIGAGVGALLDGARGRTLCAFENQAAHVRVETGVDAHFARRLPDLRRLDLRPALCIRSVGILCTAYRVTYGLALEPEALLRAHVHATRMWRQGARVIRHLGAVLERRPTGARSRPSGGAALDVLRRGVDRNGRARSRICRLSVAFLSPVRPPPWLLHEVHAALDRIPILFHRHYATGLRDLRDFNLDSGRLENDPPHHPVTQRLRSRFAPVRGPAAGALVG